MNCVVCKRKATSLSYNVKCASTIYSNTLLYTFLESIANCALTLLSVHICSECYRLVNSLDCAQVSCKSLRERLLSYLEEGAVKIQTELNLLCDESNTIISNNISRYFECLECSSQFRSKSKLALHTKEQHLSVVNEANCELNKQEQDCVSLKKEFQCDSDLNAVTSKFTVAHLKDKFEDNVNLNLIKEERIVDLQRTKVKRTGKSEDVKPYNCPKCLKKWRTLGELKSHLQSHNSARAYVCEFCGQGYKRKTSLDIHVGMHNGVNPFTCKFCNKCFTQKVTLQRHVLIHTGEKPYQCDLCGKQYIHHTSFKIHQLSHSGKKCYKCSVCGLALLSASHLKRHLRVHTGERKYACPICGKRFAEKYNLVPHQKLHENTRSRT